MKASLYGLLALAAVAFVFVAMRVSVKLRTAAARGRGVRVFDLGCDVDVPVRASTRSYQIALYLTMKSRAAEPVERPISRRATSL